MENKKVKEYNFDLQEMTKNKHDKRISKNKHDKRISISLTIKLSQMNLHVH